MLKKLLLLLSLAHNNSYGTLVTLDQSWPLVAEGLPITVSRMTEFKNDCLAYMAATNPSKPLAYPSLDSWVDYHTNLFRRYAISLETLLLNFIQTFGEDEFTYGNNLVGLFNSIEEASDTEITNCAVSLADLEDVITDLESTKASTMSSLQQKMLQLVDAKLQAANNQTPNPSVATLETEILTLVESVSNTQTTIENKTFVKNNSWVQGIETSWTEEQMTAQNTLLTPEEVALNSAIAANILDQKKLVLQLENVAFELSRVSTLAGEHNPTYQASVYQAVTDELNALHTTLTAALTQKRIDMDEGLLGGTYDPNNYTNQTPSTYVPPQVKFVSFPAFKNCWDSASYSVTTQETLDARNLEEGIMAII